MSRTLRSKRLRHALFERAGGRCQICGVELDEAWEADHVVPWSVSKRTNLFEMQALCRGCNRSKGSKMGISGGDRISLDKAFQHQKDAFNTLVGRILDHAVASLMSPPRSGKTLIYIMVAYELLRRGEVDQVLFLTRNKFLCEQVCDKKNLRKCFEILGVQDRGKFTAAVVGSADLGLRRGSKWFPDWFQGCNFAAATMAMALYEDRDGRGGVGRDVPGYLLQHVASLRNQGKRILIIADEVHDFSDANKFGEILQSLIDAGAYALVGTGTPWRADSARIPGFSYVEREREEITRYRKNQETELVEVLRGTKSQYEVRADFTYTYRQAWADERICRIDVRPIDVKLSELGEVVDDDSAIMLSELSANKVRPVIDRATRHPTVIRLGVSKALAAAQSDEDIIVYVGNDFLIRGHEENQEAKAVSAEFMLQRPGIQVLIATAADDSSVAKTLKQFRSEKYDGPTRVLVTKLAAGVGLDVPRLKVGLDLSAQRSLGPCGQRLLRPCTPYKSRKYATLITLDDVLSRDIFEQLVTEQGGQAETKLQKVDEYEATAETRDNVRTLYSIRGAVDGVPRDSDGHEGDAATVATAQRLMCRFPELQKYSVARVSQELTSAQRPVETGDGEDTGSVRRACNELVGQIYGQRKRRGVYADYEDIWKKAKTIARFDQRLPHCGDVAKLARLRDVLSKMLRNEAA